jgi:hypothetical protein
MTAQESHNNTLRTPQIHQPPWRTAPLSTMPPWAPRTLNMVRRHRCWALDDFSRSHVSATAQTPATLSSNDQWPPRPTARQSQIHQTASPRARGQHHCNGKRATRAVQHETRRQRSQQRIERQRRHESGGNTTIRRQNSPHIRQMRTGHRSILH